MASSFTNAGQRMKSVGGTMTKFVSLPLAAAGGIAVKFAADYEQALTNAVSVTGLQGKAAQAATKDMDTLAKQLGKETAFSSKEAADAMYDLASSGWDASDMGKGLRGIMDLAASTQSDLASTTETVTATLGQFGLEAGASGRISDVFTAAIGSSKANMDRLSQSMKTVGPVANALGYSVEDTTAILSKLYDAGFEGETAGTALRGALSSLMNPVGETKEGLKALGVSMDDVNPKTNSFTDILRTLKDAGMDAKTATQLFGREAAPAMLAVSDKAGGIDKLAKSLDNAGGTAKRVADQQLNTLSGQVKILGGSLQTAAITIGQKFLPILQSIVEYVIPLVNVFADLPGPVLVAVGAVAAFVAALGPLLLITGTVVSALSSLMLATGAAGLGAAFGIAVAAVGSFLVAAAPFVAVAVAMAGAGLLLYRNMGKIAPLFSRVLSVIRNFGLVLKAAASGDGDAFADMLARLPGPLRGIAISAASALVKIKTFVANFKNGLSALGGFISGWTKQSAMAWAKLPISWRAVVLGIVQGAQRIKAGLAPVLAFIRTQVAFAAKWWRQNMGLMQRAGIALVTILAARFRTGFNLLKTIVLTAVKLISVYWKTFGTQWTSIAKSVLSIVATIFRTALRQILSIVKLAAQLLVGDWRGALKTFVQIVKTSLSAALQIGKQLLNILVQAFKIAGKTILAVARAAFEATRAAIVTKIEDAKAKAVSLVNGLKEGVLKVFNSLPDPVKKVFESIGGFIWQPIESAYNKVKEWIGKILGVVNSVLKLVGLDPIGGSDSGSTGDNGSSGRGSMPARAARGHRTRRFAKGGLGTSGRQPRTHMWNEQMGNEAFIAEREPSRTQMPYLKAAAGWHGMDVVPRRSSVPSHRGGPDGTEENPRAHKHARGGISGLVRAFAYGGFGKEYFNSAASALDQAVMSRFPVDGSSYSGHPAGAVDFLVSSGEAQGQEKALGDSVAGWLDSNYNALNLRALIWYARARYEGGAWQPYVDNYGGGSGDVASQMHYNHPHAESLSASFGKLNEDQTKGFTGSGGGGGGEGGINPLVGIFNAAWDKLVQPVVDTLLKPLKASSYVMNNAVGAIAEKVPDGIKEWILSNPIFAGGGGGSGPESGNFTGSQAAVALEFAKASKGRGMPGRLPVMTALQESGMKNLDYGDADSLGYFQQRPSQGWGTPDQIMDPGYSLGKFLDGAEGYKGQYDNSATGLGAWAQAVQRSAYPDAYTKWWNPAADLIGDPKYYSEGGMTNGAQHAVIGEAGPELVLPLNSARVMQSAQSALGVNELREEVRGMRQDMQNLRVHVRDFDSPATNKLIVAQEHTTKRILNGRDGLNASKSHQGTVDKVLDLSGGRARRR